MRDIICKPKWDVISRRAVPTPCNAPTHTRGILRILDACTLSLFLRKNKRCCAHVGQTNKPRRDTRRRDSEGLESSTRARSSLQSFYFLAREWSHKVYSKPMGRQVGVIFGRSRLLLLRVCVWARRIDAPLNNGEGSRSTGHVCVPFKGRQ